MLIGVHRRNHMTRSLDLLRCPIASATAALSMAEDGLCSHAACGGSYAGGRYHPTAAL